MIKRILPLCCFLAFFSVAAAVAAGGQAPNIKWVKGPATASLGDIAEIQVPAGYDFANGDDTRKLMELMQNPPSGEEVGYLSPADSDWFLI